MYWLKYYRHGSYALTYTNLLSILNNMTLTDKEIDGIIECTNIVETSKEKVVATLAILRKRFLFQKKTVKTIKTFFFFNTSHMVSIIGDVNEKIFNALNTFFELSLNIREEKIPHLRLLKYPKYRNAVVISPTISSVVTDFPLELMEYIDAIKIGNLEIYRKYAISPSLADLINLARAILFV